MKSRTLRVLSIDLTAKGIGFVLLDRRCGLLDWGFSTIVAGDDETFRKRVTSRIERGRPTAIVLENVAPANGRENAVHRLELLMEIGSAQHLGMCYVSRTVVQRYFGVYTKADLAKMLAERFPELRQRLPPERLRWMSEDERMHIFDALSRAAVVVTPNES